MHVLVSRSLSLAGAGVALGLAAVPAQAFTPPLGTDKGSVTGPAPTSQRPDRAASPSPVAAPPAGDGIIAILIG
jgi:hypothetical protein